MENVVQQPDLTQPQKSNGGMSWAGIIKVFYTPADFFNKLKENPKVLVPYIVYGLILFSSLWIIKDILADEFLASPQGQKQLEAQAGQLTPEEFRQWLAIGQPIQWTLIYLLCPLVAAGLAYFIGRVIMGGEARFKQQLSVMLYGEIIFGMGGFLMVPFILAKESVFVSISLGAIVSDKSFANAMYLVLSKIDLFIIWEVIVIGIGLSIIYGFQRNKGYLLSVFSMGLLTILGMIASVIGTMFI